MIYQAQYHDLSGSDSRLPAGIYMFSEYGVRLSTLKLYWNSFYGTTTSLYLHSKTYEPLIYKLAKSQLLVAIPSSVDISKLHVHVLISTMVAKSSF